MVGQSADACTFVGFEGFFAIVAYERDLRRRGISLPD
jgi:hypothetical protein